MSRHVNSDHLTTNWSRQPHIQLNRFSYLGQFTNYRLNSMHFQHFPTTPQDSCSWTTLPSTNCYRLCLRFELLF